MKVRRDEQAGDENVGWVSAQMLFTVTSVGAEKSEGVEETRKAAASERDGELGDHASEGATARGELEIFPYQFFSSYTRCVFLGCLCEATWDQRDEI